METISFEHWLIKKCHFLVTQGLFLALEVTTVTSSSRYLLLRTHQLSLDAFLVALKFMHVEDVDIDEVQCILANLIYMVRESSSLLKQLPWPLEPIC